MALSFFTLDRVSSAKFGLYITGNHVYSAPERDVEYVSVPGRDGDLILDNGRYKNFSLAFSCFYHATARSFALRSRQLREWLCDKPGEYRMLETSYEPSYFRLATFAGPVDIDSAVRCFGQVDIAFNCKPFLYMKEGRNWVDITRSKKLVNPRTFVSLPSIRIYGNGDIHFTVGNRSWRFSNVDEYVEMDSEIMETFKGVTRLSGIKSGDGFPLLEPGNNNFSWSDNVVKVEILPRWRTI